MADILEYYMQAPPITRSFVTAVVLVSISCHFHLISYSWFYFQTERLWRIPPEIWRPLTSFFLSSPQLGIIMDPYFLFQYLVQLEVGNTKFPKKEDVLWYLLTVGTTIITLNHFFTGQAFFLQGMVLALCYTAVQDQRGQKASYFFFTVPAQLIPYCMMLGTLLMSPGLLPLQMTGLVAAHLHDFLTRIYPEFSGGPNLLPTPAFLSRVMVTPRILQRDYGTALRGSQPAGQPSLTGSSSGTSTGSRSVLPDSWRTRGSGQRLGGE